MWQGCLNDETRRKGETMPKHWTKRLEEQREARAQAYLGTLDRMRQSINRYAEHDISRTEANELLAHINEDRSAFWIVFAQRLGRFAMMQDKRAEESPDGAEWYRMQASSARHQADRYVERASHTAGSEVIGSDVEEAAQYQDLEKELPF